MASRSLVMPRGIPRHRDEGKSLRREHQLEVALAEPVARREAEERVETRAGDGAVNLSARFGGERVIHVARPLHHPLSVRAGEALQTYAAQCGLVEPDAARRFDEVRPLAVRPRFEGAQVVEQYRHGVAADELKQRT